MSDWTDIRKDSDHVARERRKARELRQSSWWLAQLRRGVCHYCGRVFSPGKLTMDHVVPVSRGGRSSQGNVVPSCRACNTAKRHLTPAEQILAELEEKSGGAPDGQTAASASRQHPEDLPPR